MSSGSLKKFFPGYFDSLEEEFKLVYKNKCLKFVGFDPYDDVMDNYQSDVSLWPKIEFPDISTYLLHTTNSVTLEQMKNHKSMESHTFLTSRHIKGIFVKKLDKESNKTNLVLVLGKVKHSQKANEDCLYNWILARDTGEIITAHCNCMAGMGESCSHIGAMLFLIDAGVALLKTQSCTSGINQWLAPHIKQVPYKRAREINFSSAKQRKKRMDRLIIDGNESAISKPRKKDIVPEATDEEFQNYLESLARSNSKPVILSLISPFSHKYVPKSIDLPKPLSSLKCDKDGMDNLPYEEILKECEKFKEQIKITKEQAEKVESETRQQANCKLWFSQKAGRTTASNIKAICKTSIENPSISLLNSICYPGRIFTSPATDWGIRHEGDGIAKFQEINKKHHEDLTVSKSGLVISTENPFMGASPDGIISCRCCGIGVLEIKCPYSAKDIAFEEYAKSKASCLKYCVITKTYNLDPNHTYYYQVQTEMLICDKQYCDFVIWTPTDIKIERILPDLDLQKSIIDKCSNFFQKCILPEIAYQYFTKNVIRKGIRDISQNSNIPKATKTIPNPNKTVPSNILKATETIPNSILKATKTVPNSIPKATKTVPNSIPKATKTVPNSIPKATKTVPNSIPKATKTVPKAPTTGPNNIPKAIYCYCGKEEEGKMIACDDNNCTREWFHYNCLGIKRAPRSKYWYCRDCKENRQKSK